MKISERMVAHLEQIISIAGQAGAAILNYYNGHREIVAEYKEDHSPLTEADKEANRIITDGLIKLASDIPVVSEENALLPYSVRQNWKTYWLIDPLDGTKEFINKNGEFTVNIALVENGRVVLSVVYAPAIGVFYYGDKNKGAFRRESGITKKITVRKANPDNFIAVGSRSHKDSRSAELLNKIDVVTEKSVGSSLKFCMIAEGVADIYIRTGKTSEWDTAAAQGILEMAGGKVIREDGAELLYNQKESILNPGFIALGVVPDRIEKSLLPW